MNGYMNYMAELFYAELFSTSRSWFISDFKSNYTIIFKKSVLDVVGITLVGAWYSTV